METSTSPFRDPQLAEATTEGLSWCSMAARMAASRKRHRPRFRVAEAYVEAAADGRRRLCPDATARPPGFHDRTVGTLTQWTITGTDLDQQSVSPTVRRP